MPLAGVKVPAAPATVGLLPPVSNVMRTVAVGTVVPSSAGVTCTTRPVPEGPTVAGLCARAHPAVATATAAATTTGAIVRNDRNGDLIVCPSRPA